MDAILEMLKEQNKILIEQNERLIAVLEAFAKKDIKIVVNSYNGGGTAYANNGDQDTTKVIGNSNKVEQ